MKKTVVVMVAAMLLLQLAIAASAKAKSITVTGWVIDEGCGALHTKPSGEDVSSGAARTWAIPNGRRSEWSS